jgi:hypothetical protein
MYTRLLIETTTSFLLQISGSYQRKLCGVDLTVLALVLLAAIAPAAWNGWLKNRARILSAWWQLRLWPS